jgi:hypothetical protein
LRLRQGIRPARLSKARGPIGKRRSSQRVTIDFSDDLAETLAAGSGRNVISSQVIVVGDRSIVADGAKAGLKCHPVCELSDSMATPTRSASFIVAFR